VSAPLVLDAAAVQAACSPAQAVQAITAALLGGLDPARDLAREAVAVRSGQLLFMPSDAGGSAVHVGVKIVTIAPDNPARGLPRIQASYLLYDAGTLTPVAVLDGTALTTLRTPAVSVAAVRRRLLTGAAPMRVAVVGSGPQARAHVATLATLAPARAVAAVTYLVRDPSRIDTLTDDSSVGALHTPESDDVLRAADVIVCATSARTPLFDAGLVADHAVIVAVGSHEPDARELPAALCARATVVVEDVATALREAGDVCLALQEGALAAADLVTLADVVTGRVVPDPARPLIFKSVGMSWQDLVVAEAVLGGAPSAGDVDTDADRGVGT
jgi:ornithine cyclodeaminase